MQQDVVRAVEFRRLLLRKSRAQRDLRAQSEFVEHAPDFLLPAPPLERPRDRQPGPPPRPAQLSQTPQSDEDALRIGMRAHRQ